MLIYKESAHRVVCALFFNNLNYRIMSNRTFAQSTILNRIGAKKTWSKEIQNVDGYIIEPEYIEHVEYSENSINPD